MDRAAYFRYAGENARNVVFPLGGIGAGSIGIGGDGRLRDWEIYNRPSKGSVNGFSHFAVKAERDGKVLDTRVLHGPFQGSLTGDYLGKHFNSFGFGVRREHMAGFPSFEAATLSGPYPVATLDFADKRFPGTVKLEAFSPYLPMESRLSSLPVAMFEFTLANTTAEPIDYTLFGCLGFEFKDQAGVTASAPDGRTALTGRSASDRKSIHYSELSITTDSAETSYQRHFFRGSWFDALEVYWQDINRPGRLKDRFYDDAATHRMSGSRAVAEHSTLASHVTIPAGESRTLRVAIAWYVPNASKYWVSQNALIGEPKDIPSVWRNYYATQWPSADAVAAEAFAGWDRLASQTKRLQAELLASTLPDPVLDAVSANLSIVKTATVLRLEDGTFYGWEGCHPDAGSCEGSCTHVWNYQQVLPFLFPDLERSMREADFFNNQVPSGGMAFRLALPLGIGTSNDRPCVDGQFGNVLKAYRDWKLTGDLAWLRSIWPEVKAAIGYAWHPDNYDKWDPEKSGVLTGRQHHTLDMELFGPSSWLNGFYLGALLAGSKMAEAVGEADTAAEFAEIYARGRRWTHDNLFNGSYFIQDVDLEDKQQLARFESKLGQSNYVRGSIYDLYWSDEHGQVKYQVGEGCEIDQVLAQWHAGLYGLGDVFEPEQFASAVRAVYQHNFKRRLGDEANPCRVFGLENEAGTLMCAWPEGAVRPAIPVPYSQESMHGFEYAFGCQLMMIGELDKAIEVFAAVRDRYRGHNRNPFNEIECGSNYARSMASYAAVLVLSGFGFDLSEGRIAFAPKLMSEGRFRSLWSTGTAWGSVAIDDGEARLTVIGGTLEVAEISICGHVFKAEATDHFGGKPERRDGRSIFNPGMGLMLRHAGIAVSNQPDIAQ
ncbi:GH116 family glycosyl-hydrolase [Devosia sp. LjRoot16]|uniref:GH116 family glycosyl-hydrolase n=1 Tax=Devosia sp. LjRoot16 TaxID=3342271 RepID=UPI003ED11719